MALKARLAKAIYDALDEGQKALYRAEGDAFVLDVEPVEGWGLENVTGLKTALETQKQEGKANAALVKALKNEDGTTLDVAEARAAMAKVKEFADLKPEEMAKAKVREALDQANAQHKTVLDGKTAEIDKLTSTVSAILIDQAATAALAGAGGNVKLLLPHVKSQCRVIKDDKGDFKVEVFNPTTNAGRVATKDGKAGDMTIDDLVSEMASSNDFAAGFDSKSRSGGGSRQQNINDRGQAPKTVNADDQKGLGANLEDIAAGKVTVSGWSGEPATA